MPKNKEKLHFNTLNYALDYTLHHKLSDCTLCTLNYHTYHALHPGVIFVVIFNRILLHVTSTCFLLRWNKVKRLKQLSSKQNPNFFHISLYLTWLWNRCHWVLKYIRFRTKHWSFCELFCIKTNQTVDKMKRGQYIYIYIYIWIPLHFSTGGHANKSGYIFQGEGHGNKSGCFDHKIK